MMIGFDYYELRNSKPDITNMILLFTAILFVFGIIVAVTCEGLPSNDIEQELIAKKCEYLKGYIDSKNMIPTWQKEL